VLKKTIAYEDFNGEDVVEEHYFHLTMAELVEIEVSFKGGLSEAMKRIIATEDGETIMKEVKNIILKSYGVRSPDGRQFTKNAQLREEFEATGAYSALFMELVTNAGATAEFINGIVPAKLAEEATRIEAATKLMQEGKDQPPKLEEVPKPPDEELKEPEVISLVSLREMDGEDLQSVNERLKSGQAVLGD